MVEYVEIIGPYAMSPSDMKYVEKVFKSVKIPVRNTGRETYYDSTKQLSVPKKYESIAMEIYTKLKYNFYADKKIATTIINKYRGVRI